MFYKIKMSKLVILKDNSKEAFTQSQCTCDFCENMHQSVKEWDKFVPVTHLQKGMMAVVDKIEARTRVSKVR